MVTHDTLEFSHGRLSYNLRLAPAPEHPNLLNLHVISLMVSPSTMDTTTTTPAANSDLEIRISRIADPHIGMISVIEILVVLVSQTNPYARASS